MASFVRHGRFQNIIFHQNSSNLILLQIPACCQRVQHRKLSYHRWPQTSQFQHLTAKQKGLISHQGSLWCGITGMRWNSTTPQMKTDTYSFIPPPWAPEASPDKQSPDPPPVSSETLPDAATSLPDPATSLPDSATSLPDDSLHATATSLPEEAATPAPDTEAAPSSTLPEGYIPEPPPIPVPEPAVPVELNTLGEPTLASLGLCNYTPPGAVQKTLELLHVSGGLEWWQGIVLGTVCLRILMFPLVIISQRNTASMHNNMPTIQRLQERFTNARMAGNILDAAKTGAELQEFMTRNKVNPLKNMLVPLAQMPVFMSVFIGMRKMANLPVESMTTGGLLWIKDLTVPDPFYIVPVLTMASFLLTIEMGVDGVRAANMSHAMRWGLRIMPVVILPFIINFPAAMLCYWFTSNTFSLLQVLFLKLPGMRATFKIPAHIQHPEHLAPKKKGFLQGFKENWNNSKTMAKVEDRQKAEMARFRDAGTGPIVRTYNYDPTKAKPKNK